jgi:hypothetical protein
MSSHRELLQVLQNPTEPQVAMVGDDGRLLVLFDLNGVLVTKNVSASGRRGIPHVRPGIGHLISLLPHFRHASTTPLKTIRH